MNCECESFKHEEVACKGAPEIAYDTPYGIFHLCYNCVVHMHMPSRNFGKHEEMVRALMVAERERQQIVVDELEKTVKRSLTDDEKIALFKGRILLPITKEPKGARMK